MQKYNLIPYVVVVKGKININKMKCKRRFKKNVLGMNDIEVEI
jgi:hypothetical protein